MLFFSGVWCIVMSVNLTFGYGIISTLLYYENERLLLYTKGRNRLLGIGAKNIGIDLGTANTIVYIEGKGIVLREPSVVARNKKSGEVIAVGEEARDMIGRTPASIVAIRPMKDGVIADYDTTVAMMKHYMEKALGKNGGKPYVMVCVPSGVTEVEKRAVIDATRVAGARDAYVIEELITEKAEVLDKEAYYDSIVNTIIEIGSAENFIIALAELIQRLVVDHLHILGDIYDRGPAPHFIMDRLMQYHSLDIQWGNHDVVWMGAAAGQKACIATVVRNSIRYGNLDILEDGYGINMLPLATFVMEAYKDDPCEIFARKGASNYNVLEEELGKKIAQGYCCDPV